MTKGDKPTALHPFFTSRPTQQQTGIALGKRKASDAEQGEEDGLRKALALSAAEARVASMDDDEQLKAAIEQSLAEGSMSYTNAEAEDADQERRGPSLTKDEAHAADDEAEGKHSKDVSSASAAKADDDARTLPELTEDSFDDRRQVTINRLNGSLDLVYCKGWIKKQERARLREWLLCELAWHRVTYVRPKTNVRIVTPRYTATFGKDDTGAAETAYRSAPKPLPAVLARLRDALEAKTASRFNAIIINYYADGNDSISYHADDEAFLGANPTIASLSLGASRDFYLRRKAPAHEDVPPAREWERMGTKGKGAAMTRPTERMTLDDGDLLIMRGRTQADWEHSIPKRASHVAGRINMTFRRVINVSGTNNFIRYNRVGDGDEVQFRWNAQTRRMVQGVGGM